MEARGRVKDIVRNWKTGDYIVSFTIPQLNPESVNGIFDKDLDITAKEHKERRSLNANALLWACLGEIAGSLMADKWDIYLYMLRRYGQFTYISVLPDAVDAVKRQWRECEVVGEIEIFGKKAVQMLCYYGSSTYNSKEFSILLDGVISEMKEIGLDPPMPERVKASLEAWEKMCDEKRNMD